MSRVTSKYMFTLMLDFERAVLGEFPDGQRVDLRYAGKAQTDRTRLRRDWPDATEGAFPAGDPSSQDGQAVAASPRSPEWNGFDGQVISGSDLALLRNDCVSAFNGTMTIRANDRYLLNARVSGVVDLFRTEAGKRATLVDYKQGITRKYAPAVLDRDLDVSLHVVFEGATAREQWEDENKNKSYQQEKFFRYQRLLRNQFMLVGKVTPKGGVAATAVLDVLEVQGS